MTDSITLVRGSTRDLPALEPLWISVHRRHSQAMPELAPYVDDATAWAVRRELYVELLSKPDSVLFMAHARGTAVGYGLAHVMRASQTWLADTWSTGPLIGEIETLAVLPEYRDLGIGTRLLDALEMELGAKGVHDLVLGALPGNAAAIRLYERRGYRPTWLYLSRLETNRSAAPSTRLDRP